MGKNTDKLQLRPDLQTWTQCFRTTAYRSPMLKRHVNILWTK